MAVEPETDGIDAVLFDWAGTLTPFHEIDVLGHWVAAAHESHPDDAERVGRALLDAERAVMDRVRSTWRSATLDDVFEAAGVEPEQPILRRYFEEWTAHTHTLPEAGPVFAAVHAAGARVGIVSNTLWSRAWHDEVFRRDGVLDAIDVAVYSSEAGHVKPHHRPFEMALEALGIEDRGRVVYVGDRLHEDVGGAGSLGMRTVFIPHSTIPEIEKGRDDVIPDHVIDRLSDLVPLLHQG